MQIFGASVRFAKLLGSRNSAATLTATGDIGASLDARSQGPGASSAAAAPVAGRCSSSPQPHISAGLTWPEPVPVPGGQAFVASYGTSTPVCAATPTQASVSSTACSPLPSTTTAWWSPFSAAPHSPASAPGRSRPPSRVLTVAEEDLSFSAAVSAGNDPLDLPATAAGIAGSTTGSGSSRRRPSGSVLSPSLMLAMISCPGRAMTSAGGSGGVPPLCRTPSEGQLLAGTSFFRASRRPLRTSYAIPEHLEVEGAEVAETTAEAAVEAEAAVLGRTGEDGNPATPPADVAPARRSHSDLVLRSAAEAAGGNCSGKASLSFTWGGGGTADGAPAGGPGAPVGSGGGGTSSRLAGLIRALVFNKPGSTASTAGQTPGLESSPSAGAGSGAGGSSVGGLVRRISNARGGGGTTPSSIRTSSVALAAAALLSRRPSWLTANSPVSSSTVQENETSEAFWSPDQQQQQQQQQQGRSHHRRRRDQQEQEEDAEEHQETAEDEDEVEVALFGGGTCVVTPPSPSRFHRGRIPGRGHGVGGATVVTPSYRPSLEQLPSESLPSVGLDNPSEHAAVPSVHRAAARAAAVTAAAATPGTSTAAASKVPTASSTSGGGWRDELFLPPESQQDPLCRVDASHDTWAFGMLLWAMAAGEPPVEGQTAPGTALNCTALCPPMGMLSTLELDLGIRAPAWPASCHTHSHLQSLYEACITKEPGSRPSMATVRAQLEWLERQLREEHVRSRAAATAAALNGFMLLDDQHQRHARHHHRHQQQQQQQQRSPPRVWLQGQVPFAATGYGANSDALQQLQQQQQNQMLPYGRRPLMRMAHGDLMDLWSRPRGPPPPSPPHPRPQGGHPPRGLPGGPISQLHDPTSQLSPYSQHPQQHPLPTLQQQHVLQQRQRQQPGEQQQGQQQEQQQQQQQRGWPVGLSSSLPAPFPYIYARGGLSPL
ncbi:hypothetical protein Vafri_13388 [Volvox africanus]|nr:hypothetical protein Vafri_13388 [Volvox africanus]